MAVAVVMSVVYLGSDARATSLVTADAGAVPPVPEAADAVPGALAQVWELPTDPRYGAVSTPYGTVVTTQPHGVAGYSASDAAPLWTYERRNAQLCAVGSGDTVADPLESWTGVHGVMTVFAKNGYCSGVTVHDPSTGERLFVRTSPNQHPGTVFFGSPYVGFVGSDYLELWRHDLVATIRYGNQPNPVKAHGPRLGCQIQDAAVTKDQLATIERCSADGVPRTVLVMNWPTPGDAPGADDAGWDTTISSPKAEISLPSSDAIIVGVTAERVAVMVADPEPTLLTYDAHGELVGEQPVEVAAADIRTTASSGITPVLVSGKYRFSLVGSTVVVTTWESVSVTEAAPTADGGDDDEDATASQEERVIDSPLMIWVAPHALGLPALVSTSVLVPVRDGLAVHAAVDGVVLSTIPVPRPEDPERVDVSMVGNTVVEIRGDHVVGLREPVH